MPSVTTHATTVDWPQAMKDPRLYAPAVVRNREAIVAVLRRVLPTRGDVLEIASGTGEHVVHFAEAFPRLTFQPSDLDANARASIDAWAAKKRLANVRPAVFLDATAAPRPIGRADAILCINMIHIAPWAATRGLFHQAYDLLEPGGLLYLYGPYIREGIETAPSNLAFDASLRAQNPDWGLRDLAAVEAVARENDFSLAEVVEMPANNLSVIFRRF
jgi:SAM-dependent methyltransferase